MTVWNTADGVGRHVAVDAQPEKRIRIDVVIQPGTPDVNIRDWTGLYAREVIRQHLDKGILAVPRGVHIHATLNIGQLDIFCRIANIPVGQRAAHLTATEAKLLIENIS